MVLSSVLGLRKRAAETMGCGAALCRVFFERGFHGRTELMAWLRRRLGGRRAALSNQGPVGWQDRSRQTHRAVAGWAARPGCGAGRSGIQGRPGVELEWHSGMDLNALALGFGGRMAEAVVANRAQAGGQDMAQIVAHEFGAG